MKKILYGSLFFFLSSVLILGQNSNRDLTQAPENFNNPEYVYGEVIEGDAGILSESFEDVTFPPAGWTKANPDGGTGWNRQTAGTTPIPGWNGGTITTPPGGGNAVAFATWNTGGAVSNDQWLISPQITNVQTGDMLSFWIQVPGYTNGSYLDSVDVLISTTGTNIGDFNVIVDQLFWPAASPDTNWTEYVYSLTNFVSAGSNIYIAWREHVSDNLNDGAAVCLDLVEVTSGGSGTITIAEAIEDLDMDFVPDRLGQTVTVEGVLFSPNFQTNNSSYYIDDGTAGVDIFMFGPPIMSFTEGDLLTITGEVDQFNGLTEIAPVDSSGWVLVSSGNPQPAPIVLTLTQYLADAELYEGRLIAFGSLTMVGGTWPSPGSSATIQVSDGIETVDLRIDSDTDIDDNPEPVWPRDIIAIGNQFSTSTPPNDGYQILPRYYSDFLPPGTVPVELTSFTATAVQGAVMLNWSTATETNNLGFEVERKTNGEFRTLGFVEGNGTTTEIQNYSFTDRSAITGANYYRLKQIDYDGRFNYSPIVEIDFTAPTEFQLQQNYPNPFNPSTKIVYSLAVDSKVTLTVFDILGQEVTELFTGHLVAGVHELDFNASGINSGVYFYTLSAQGVDGSSFNATKKMILTK